MVFCKRGGKEKSLITTTLLQRPSEIAFVRGECFPRKNSSARGIRSIGKRFAVGDDDVLDVENNALYFIPRHYIIIKI